LKPSKILAIIPARAGSVGIKNKNLQQILGKSLVAWTVGAAKGSRFDLRVVVSTDGQEIAGEAIRCGAEVVMRPPAISDGLAKSEDALLHVLDELDRKESYSPEIIVFLQCTSPLTSPEDIDGTIDALLDDGADSALAVTPSHYFLWKQRPDGTWDGVNHDKLSRPMRQQREPEFLETGAVYVLNTEGFLKSKHRFFGRTAVYVMPPERRLEIDDWSDLSLARIIMEKHGQSVEKRPVPAHPSALILDFDGVLTDDRVIVDEHGTESVCCHRGDGLGISRLRETGFPILILSKEKNPVVQARATKLRIPCLQGIDDKAGALSEWTSVNQIDLSRAIYIGNDINDLPVFPLVGCAVAVADAHPEVLASADLILKHPGGHGAVREMTDRIIQLTTKPIPA